MNNYFAKQKVNQLLKKHSELVMLNVGCGTAYMNGWINIDNNSDHNIEKLDFNWDLRNPLPFPDSSVDFIFNEHFVEHLSPEEALISLRDFMRVLKPGGVLRIAMPDLAEAVRNYLDVDWKKQDFIKAFNLDFVQTRAEMLNMNFRWWGHKWLYDWDELARRLNEVNCHDFIQSRQGKSAHEQLCNLETRAESNLIAEITK